MNRAPTSIAALALAGCLAPPPIAQDLQPQDAIDAVLEAFDTHPLVALSEGSGHGQLETRDFFIRLIQDKRFPQTLRHVVIEFGNARHQSVMDRYLAGEAVARDDLRHVWEDTTQVTGVWSLPMYEQMLGAVRAVNQGLPADRRIRVLLADPPIDWSTVTSPADEDMNDWRDAHFAHVIERAVMNRSEKGLLLFGGAHLSRKVILPNSLIHLLDRRFPGQTRVVSAINPDGVDPDVATRVRRWQVPSAAAVRGTWLGRMDVQQIGFGLSRGVIEDDVDIVLLLSSAPPRSDQPAVLSSAYQRELSRRQALHRATLPFRGGKIRFEDGAAGLAPEANEPLQAVLKELQADRGLRLLVKAFADASEPDVVPLSTRRAELLVDRLVQHGVERGRLVAKGCGDARPLNLGNTAEERAMNRRAELVRLTPMAGCEPPW